MQRFANCESSMSEAVLFAVPWPRHGTRRPGKPLDSGKAGLSGGGILDWPALLYCARTAALAQRGLPHPNGRFLKCAKEPRHGFEASRRLAESIAVA